MQDMLPFPNINSKDTEEQIFQINNYLIQFKETLEFILTNISTDNLSQDLVNQLNSLGADIEKTIESQEDQLQQVSSKVVTVSDVINSSAFDVTVKAETARVTKEELKNLKFSVNYNTGNLEYTMS